MKNKTTAKSTCTYENPDTFVMTCKEKPAEQEVVKSAPQEVEQPVTQQPSVETPVVEQIDTEEIAVPVVGDVEEVEDSYVEPLGVSTSWYPESTKQDNIVNYSYDKSSEFVASLPTPEVGFQFSDILLIAIIALSWLAIVSSIAFLTSKSISGRAHRKNLIKSN